MSSAERKMGNRRINRAGYKKKREVLAKSKLVALP